MTDLIERLRKEEGRRTVRLANNLQTKYAYREVARAMLREAADELEAARVERDELRDALKELITWIPSADTYRRLGFDPEAPMRALRDARAILRREGKQ